MKVLISCAVFVSCASSLNILVYNFKLGVSHSTYLGRVADVLVEAGHNVTSLIPELVPEIFEGTTKSTIIRIPQDPEAGSRMALAFNGPQFDPFTQGSIPWLNLIFGFYLGQTLIQQCDVILNDEVLMRQLEEAKFDVVITETIDFCGVGIFPLIKAKSFISVSTTPFMESTARLLGIPHAYSHNPSWGVSHLDPHSFMDRLWNVIDDHVQMSAFVKARSMYDDHFSARYGSEFPTMEHIVSRSVFHFTNNEPLLDFARPLLPKVINLGGLGAREPRPLDKFWDGMLNQRATNVLVSFGSVAKSHKMPIDMKRSFIKARPFFLCKNNNILSSKIAITVFSRLSNVTFVWKYEYPEDEFATSEAATVMNLHLVKWTPQNDLLADPRLSLFISHGGAGSTFECALRGVPGVFIPLFVDQPRNAGMMAHSGIAVVYDKFDLMNTDKLASTIKRVLDNPGLFREKAKRMAFLLSKRPFSPEELLVNHVEFAGESGTIETMIPVSLDLSIVEYYMIDVAFVMVFSVVLLIFITCYLISKCIRTGMTKSKEE